MQSANQKIQGAQDKFYLSWLEWKRSIGHDDTDESHCAEVRQWGQPSTTVLEDVLKTLFISIFLLSSNTVLYHKFEQYFVHGLVCDRKAKCAVTSAT